ncbi:MAG: 3-oxoacyl-ACP synthase [Mycobacterium sp.]|nr:3-oxoacyl-ACP synthase [Mycobacterium sp.]
MDLLINAGIYRNRNLGEPALAAIIQEDIGANPEDPHSDAHGTFSFDIANGACGVLTGIQVADGFLRSHTVSRALVVASDADPGRGKSERFPFSPVGAALLCRWSDDNDGLGQFHWTNLPDDGENFRATIAFDESGNVLRFRESAALHIKLATAGAQAVRRCLDEAALDLSDVAVIVAAPANHRYHQELGERLGVAVERIAVANDEHIHTAALVAALEREALTAPAGAQILLVTAGAGIVAGAALYRMPAG